MQDVRAIENIRLECDWCGIVPDTLYLPTNHSGVFCRNCLADVLSPPPKLPVKLAPDGEAVDDVVEVSQKLSTFLKRYKPQPIFCGRGRPGRPRKDPTLLKPPAERPVERATQNWKFFSRGDVIRITSTRPFRGVRAQVWSLLSDGITIDEALARSKGAGLPEAQVVAILRKLVLIYRVLSVEKAAALC